MFGEYSSSQIFLFLNRSFILYNVKQAILYIKKKKKTRFNYNYTEKIICDT